MSEIMTPRLRIVPFDMKYLDFYYREWNEEVTKYQYPDPYSSIEDARMGLQSFIDEMERGETLFLTILKRDNDVPIGGFEVHGLKEDVPELGVWIERGEWNKGYASETLEHMLSFLKSHYPKERYLYEADVRNEPSMSMVSHLNYEKRELDEFTTESGKALRLQQFYVRL